jgi:hypothetical protein
MGIILLRLSPRPPLTLPRDVILVRVIVCAIVVISIIMVCALRLPSLSFCFWRFLKNVLKKRTCQKQSGAKDSMGVHARLRTTTRHIHIPYLAYVYCMYTSTDWLTCTTTEFRMVWSYCTGMLVM